MKSDYPLSMMSAEHYTSRSSGISINGTLTNFVIDNAEYFNLKINENDSVRLIPSKKEPGEFRVRIGSNESDKKLVVCPVGQCIAKINPKSQEIIDMDEEEFLQQKF